MPSRAFTFLDSAEATRERIGWLPFLPAALIHILIATWNIALPGLYMDAVNPDYLVVKILNPGHQPIVSWVLDGNYIFGHRLPVLIQLYHGSQTFWLGLPLYALFGTTIEGVRLTHAVFALGVLAASFYLLRRAGLRGVFAGAACICLALDPVFSYAFRTQSYITLAPAMWLLWSVALLMPDRVMSPRAWAGSGILAGLAAGAYFIQGFFLLALVPSVWAASRRVGVECRTARMRWLGGLVVGLSPVLLGYALLINDKGGLRGAIHYFADRQAQLHAFSSPLSVPERVAYMWRMLETVTSNAWQNAMMFGTWDEVPAAQLKTVLLIILPPVLWLLSELRGSATFASRVLTAMPAAFLLVTLAFGNRLGGHHYVVLLPWLYLWLAVTLRDAAAGLHLPRGAATVTASAVFVAAIGVNTVGQVVEARTLQRTGGVGLMSDAIDRLADDLNAMPDKPFVFFPDWGLALPIAFLTRGTVGMKAVEDYAHARALLCEGLDVEVALIHDRDARRAAWTRALDWDEPTVTPYRQRDGKVVFDRIDYRARKGDPRCR